MLPVKLHKLWLFATIFTLAMGQQDLFGQRFSVAFNPLLPETGQSVRITAENLQDIDWMQVDRRAEDCECHLTDISWSKLWHFTAWYHLYPFGERYFDSDFTRRPWNDKQIDLDFFFPFYGFRFNYSFVSDY